MMIDEQRQLSRVKKLTIVMVVFDMLMLAYWHTMVGGEFFEYNFDLPFKLILIVGLCCKIVLLFNNTIRLRAIKIIGIYFSPVLLLMLIINMSRLLFPPFLSKTSDFPKYFGFYFELYFIWPILLLYLVSTILYIIFIPKSKKAEDHSV